MPKPLYRLVQTSQPAQEPITLSEAKAYLRVSHDSEDSIISAMISAARQACENHTGRAFITRTYSFYMDAWPSLGKKEWWDGMRDGVDLASPAPFVTLPHPPLVAVSALKIYASDDMSQTMDSALYYVDSAGGRLVLRAGTPMPLPARNANGIEISYSAGYGDADAVPQLVKQAMRQLVAYMYEHRGDDMNMALRASGAATLLQPLRIVELP